MKRRGVFSVAIGLLAVALTGCPERTSIGNITHDPGRYTNKEVTIVGRVTNGWGAAMGGAYEIDDGTGKLWVITEKYGSPTKDAYVGVTGKVLTGFVYAGRNYATIMRETQRRTRPNK
ncbi:MAG TPA: hypothetical protein VFV34_18725 [Blastocatellia bacterium]|nr:hypothetical protein [Blastocatellia bacterium]